MRVPWQPPRASAGCGSGARLRGTPEYRNALSVTMAPVARTRAVTILFCDLVASTERRARLGDDRFDDFTVDFLHALRSTIADANGREVKSAGDGLMVAFPESVADAIVCATAMHRVVAALDPDDPARLRIGIGTGEVAESDGDFQGMPIVEAARLEAAAEPGQTLTTAVVRALVGTRRGLQFRDVGALTLKGLPAPLPACEVVDVDAPPPAPPIAAVPRPRARTRRRRTWMVVAAVLAVPAGLLVVRLAAHDRDAEAHDPAGVTPPSGYTPRVETRPCPDDLAAIDPEVTCSDLVVPQDRSHPEGRQLRLLVTRAPARTPVTGVDPTIDVCGCENPANSVARDHAELIQIAIRGLPGSDPVLTCPEATAARRRGLTEPSSDRAAEMAVANALARCHDRLESEGVDPSQYNFPQAARDVTDLMVALGLERADFLAHGDTDFIVFDIARRAPAAVRSITLDNPPPPGHSSFAEPTIDLEAAFRRYTDLCEADPVCARAYPDLLATWKPFFETLRATPVLLAGRNPADDTAPPIPVLVDGDRAADSLRYALGDSATYALIPAVLAETTPDAVVVDTLLQHDDLLWREDAPWGAIASYVCSYHVHVADPNVLALAARTWPEFVGEAAAHWTRWCASWNVPDVSSVVSVDFSTPIPTFIFRGDLSPDGSVEWVQTLARGLPNGQTAIFPTLGENLLATGPTCLSDLRRQFLAHPDAPLPIDACVAQSPPIPFTAPG
jgi:class 3 adenylate cyclase/pimeloyl-ACP methyl ester carboxylesterase